MERSRGAQSPCAGAHLDDLTGRIGRNLYQEGGVNLTRRNHHLRGQQNREPVRAQLNGNRLGQVAAPEGYDTCHRLARSQRLTREADMENRLLRILCRRNEDRARYAASRARRRQRHQLPGKLRAWGKAKRNMIGTRRNRQNGRQIQSGERSTQGEITGNLKRTTHR